jgi:hypothetical protein
MSCPATSCAAPAARSRHRSPAPAATRLVVTGALAALCGVPGLVCAAPAPDAGVVAGTPTPGVTPFIAFVPLQGTNIVNADSVRFRIAPAPGSVSKPVNVTYSMDYLVSRGYASPASGTMTVPVFALYDGAVNDVTIKLHFKNKATTTVPVTITTATYVDPFGIYDRPLLVHPRAAGPALGFDFFYMKSSLGSPVIVDTDGRLRWAVPGFPPGYASTFTDNGFVNGSSRSLQITRAELDGTITLPALIQSTDGTNFSHSVDFGKQGLMGELDLDVPAAAGAAAMQPEVRSTATEFDPQTGEDFHEWNFVNILSNYMRSHGDDPALFVRPDTDWFHMNMVFYDASDDSVIVSSRENFVMKIDYATSAIKWIFGDPTKYWYTFPSLRARSLTLAPGGLVPIGQHSTTIAPDGNLLLFNNGTPSFNQPKGEPKGARRLYSAVASYKIDEAHMTVTQQWVFDYGQSLQSRLCSSARQLPDGSVLVDYAQAAGGTQTHIVGLNPAHEVVFDYQYVNHGGCRTSWNSQPIALDALSIQ